MSADSIKKAITMARRRRHECILFARESPSEAHIFVRLAREWQQVILRAKRMQRANASLAAAYKAEREDK